MLEQLLKDEKKYSNLSATWADDIANKINIEQAIEKFKTYITKLDYTREKIYIENLKKLNYKPSTMEEEKERLITLISVIEKRISQRSKTKREYDKVLKMVDKEKDNFWNEYETNNTINDVNNLETYQERLKHIDIYLERKNRTIALEEKINIDSIQLEEALKTKENNTQNNGTLELELNEYFFQTFKNIDYLSDETNDNEITLYDLEDLLKEKLNIQERNLKQLNALAKSSPKDKSIKDRLSQKREKVKESRVEFFEIKERIGILSIIKLLASKDPSYEATKDKRERIVAILNERSSLISKYRLKIEDDRFERFNALVCEQLKSIYAQEPNNASIKRLTETIEKNKNEVESLEESNKEEIYQELANEFYHFVGGDAVEFENMTDSDYYQGKPEEEFSNNTNLEELEEEPIMEEKTAVIEDSESITEVDADTQTLAPYESQSFSSWKPTEDTTDKTNSNDQITEIPTSIEETDLDKGNDQGVFRESESSYIPLIGGFSNNDEKTSIDEKTSEMNEELVSETEEPTQEDDMGIDALIRRLTIPEAEEIQEKKEELSSEPTPDTEGIDALIGRVTKSEPLEESIPQENNDNKPTEIKIDTPIQETEELLDDEQIEKILASLVGVENIPQTMNIREIKTRTKGILQKVFGKFQPKRDNNEKLDIDQDGNVIFEDSPVTKRRTIE